MVLMRIAARRCIAALAIAIAGSHAVAETPDWIFGIREVELLPAPEPFTLDARTAIQASAMLRRSRFLQWYEVDGESGPRTVVVDSVRAVVVDRDPDPSPPNRSRYDIILNGKPIDWDNLYVLYRGRMTNLRLLFTYRNQRPVPEDPYLIPDPLDAPTLPE